MKTLTWSSLVPQPRSSRARDTPSSPSPLAWCAATPPSWETTPTDKLLLPKQPPRATWLYKRCFPTAQPAPQRATSSVSAALTSSPRWSTWTSLLARLQVRFKKPADHCNILLRSWKTFKKDSEDHLQAWSKTSYLASNCTWPKTCARKPISSSGWALTTALVVWWSQQLP